MCDGLNFWGPIVVDSGLPSSCVVFGLSDGRFCFGL